MENICQTVHLAMNAAGKDLIVFADAYVLERKHRDTFLPLRRRFCGGALE